MLLLWCVAALVWFFFGVLLWCVLLWCGATLLANVFFFGVLSLVRGYSAGQRSILASSRFAATEVTASGAI
jgi:hypothetical protein